MLNANYTGASLNLDFLVQNVKTCDNQKLIYNNESDKNVMRGGG